MKPYTYWVSTSILGHNTLHTLGEYHSVLGYNTLHILGEYHPILDHNTIHMPGQYHSIVGHTMSDVYDIFGIVEDMERPLVHVHLGYSVRLLGLFPRVSLPKEKLRMVGKQY